MAATSLLRLVIIFVILIALALSSGIAWGTLTMADDDTPSLIRSVEAPTWPFGDESKDP